MWRLWLAVENLTSARLKAHQAPCPCRLPKRLYCLNESSKNLSPATTEEQSKIHERIYLRELLTITGTIRGSSRWVLRLAHKDYQVTHRESMRATLLLIQHHHRHHCHHLRKRSEFSSVLESWNTCKGNRLGSSFLFLGDYTLSLSVSRPKERNRNTPIPGKWNPSRRRKKWNGGWWKRSWWEAWTWPLP